MKSGLVCKTVITNFAVITNVVIKRVHCNQPLFSQGTRELLEVRLIFPWFNIPLIVTYNSFKCKQYFIQTIVHIHTIKNKEK